MSQSIVALPAPAQGAPGSTLRLARFLAKVRLTLWVRNRWLGMWWWLLQPLVMTATYVAMVQYAFGSKREHHGLLVMCAMLPWTCFVTSGAQAGGSLTRNKLLLQAFRVNYLAFPTSEVLATTVRFLFSFVVLGLLMWFYRVPPTVYLAWIPLLVAVQFLFTLGIGFLLAASQVFVEDTANIWSVTTRVWFFLSPSIYTLEDVRKRAPEKFLEVYRLNPFATLFTSYRDVVIHGRMPDLGYLAYVTLVGALTLLAGVLVLRRLQGVIPKHL